MSSENEYDVTLLDNQIRRFLTSFRETNHDVSKTFNIECAPRVVCDVDIKDLREKIMKQFSKLRTNALSNEQIESLKCIKQHLSSGTANSAWLRAREMRITSSVIGSATHLGKYGSPAAALKDYIFSRTFFGNAATQYGNSHESDAEEAFRQFWKSRIFTRIRESNDKILVNFNVSHLGLCVNKEKQFLAGSPDGLLTLYFNDSSTEKRLIEYKCPYSMRNYIGKGTLYPRDKIKKSDRVLCIPGNYYAQIHHLMRILECDRAEFVVWTPNIVGDEQNPITDDAMHFYASNGTIERTLVEFDVPYFTVLSERAEYFFKYYLMIALVFKKEGLLVMKQFKMRNSLFRKMWGDCDSSSSSGSSDDDSKKIK